jgi:hypothetical protein
MGAVKKHLISISVDIFPLGNLNTDPFFPVIKLTTFFKSEYPYWQTKLRMGNRIAMQFVCILALFLKVSYLILFS